MQDSTYENKEEGDSNICWYLQAHVGSGTE